MQRRSGVFNPKRVLMPAERVAELHAHLDVIAGQLRYGGDPEHKRNPGDFNLTPLAAPRRGTTLCDDVPVFRRSAALSLLQAGMRRGLVDGRWSGEGSPPLIWAVAAGGMPMEAQREAEHVYHGYRMPEADPFREVVLQRWYET